MDDVFVKEAPEVKAERKYREHHDAQGHYFPNPNRRQRRHIANTWKYKPSKVTR